MRYVLTSLIRGNSRAVAMLEINKTELDSQVDVSDNAPDRPADRPDEATSTRPRGKPGDYAVFQAGKKPSRNIDRPIRLRTGRSSSASRVEARAPCGWIQLGALLPESARRDDHVERGCRSIEGRFASRTSPRTAQLEDWRRMRLGWHGRGAAPAMPDRGAPSFAGFKLDRVCCSTSSSSSRQDLSRALSG